MGELEDAVIISVREYEDLLYAKRQLEHLEAEGVDNWEGYSRVSRYED